MHRDRLHDGLSAILLTTGSLVFLWGGAQHPPTDSSLGTPGTAEYFRAFASHVAADGNWQTIHSGILAGPILWALGAVGLCRRFASSGEGGWPALGLMSLGMGAASWAVAFVLDGFIAPLQAAAIVATDSSTAAVDAFRNNQEIVIRLGLVSWLLIGAGIASISAAAWLSGQRRRFVRWFVVPVGLLVGLWPLAAWVAGPFRPGPFTSELWTVTAILTSVWFLAGAAAIVRPTSASAAHHRT